MSEFHLIDPDDPIGKLAERWAAFAERLDMTAEQMDLAKLCYYCGAEATIDLAFNIFSHPLQLDRGAAMWKLQRECLSTLAQIAARDDAMGKDLRELLRLPPEEAMRLLLEKLHARRGVTP